MSDHGNRFAGVFFPSVKALFYGCALITLAAPQAIAADSDKIACAKAASQAPRDITKPKGSNPVRFAKAPPPGKMHLCDIHFHRFAEHRAKGYTELAGKGNHRGYVCNGHSPTAAHGNKEGHGAAAHGCKGIAAGDTVEVHWVFTTCDVKPGPTLNSCFTSTCKNPELRVEARVFYLSEDKGAGDFRKYTDLNSGRVSLPAARDTVEYPGSTTGDKYNDGSCSPFNVTWNVGSVCSPLNLQSINSWCGKDKNPFKEDHAHGVRKLVTGTGLLSPVR